MIAENFHKSFDNHKVLRLLGAKRGRRASSASLRRIDSFTDKMDSMLKPRLCYRMVGLAEVTPAGVRLSEGTRFRSPKLARALSRAESICCFVATVGPAVDVEIQRLLQQRRYADAYVLDALGSTAAENVVEQFHRRMTARRKEKNGAVTLRFSPGYCDWPIQEQRPLFNLIAKTDKPGVILNDRCLMTPRKSVSGLFGILPPGVESGPEVHNPCDTCGKRDCIARRRSDSRSI
jgi:hypothetical protein